MKQLLLLALCVGLSLPLAGCDFIGGGDNVSLPVSAVRVDDLPLRNRGEDWDASSGPDIVIEIQDTSGRALYRSDAQNDVDLEAGPLTFEVPQLTVTRETMPLFVVVYETDGNRLEDTRIRTSESFRIPELAGVDHLLLEDIGGRSLSAEVWRVMPTAE